MGYSVGRWDGDTLIVDGVGFNDKTWLSRYGQAHTEALRVRERYRRRDFGHLEVEATYTEHHEALSLRAAALMSSYG